MNVTLDQATAEKLQALLDRGVFASAGEALTDAVRLLEEHYPNDWLWENREYVRAAIEESYASEQCGEVFTPEEVKAYLEQRHIRFQGISELSLEPSLRG